MDEIITYSQYQKLSDADKAKYTTKWNADGKSGIAVLTGSKTERNYESGKYAPKPTATMSAAPESYTPTPGAKSQAERDTEKGDYTAKNYTGEYSWSDDELKKHVDYLKSQGKDKEASQAQAELVRRASERKPTKEEPKKLTWADIRTMHNDDPEKIAQWLNSNPGYTPGDLTKSGMDTFGYELKNGSWVKKEEPKAETPVTEEPTEESAKDEEPTEEPSAATNQYDPRQFSRHLSMFAIQAYKNGEFGDPKSSNAKKTLGYFIMDKLAKSIYNAGAAIKGGSQMETAWSERQKENVNLMNDQQKIDWWMSLSKEEKEAAIKTGVISGATAEMIYTSTNDQAIENAAKRDVSATEQAQLVVDELSLNNKKIATDTIAAYQARKAELQQMVNELSKPDSGWDTYAKAMNAYVGTARGLSSTGAINGEQIQSGKSFSDSLTAEAKTGKIASLYVDGGVTNNSQWANSSSEALSKTNTMNQDALALSKYSSGEAYAKASRDETRKANAELIENLKQQIDYLDKMINLYAKPLGLGE